MAFHPADYVVFVITMVASLGIGIFYSVRGQNTATEYIHGNRNLGVVPVSLSIIVTIVSPVTLQVS